MGTSLLPPDFKDFLKLLNSKQVEYLLVEVNLISLKHLEANKKASGRLKDLTDLEYLP